MKFDGEDDPLTVDGSIIVGGDFTNKSCVVGDGIIVVDGTLDNQDCSLFGCTDGGDDCCATSVQRSGGCSIAPEPPVIHTSVQSGDWEDKDTWDTDEVPNNEDNVIIATGHTVLLDKGGTPKLQDFTIQSGGIFLQDNKDVEIHGAYTNNGNHTFYKKKLIFTTSGQVIDGSGGIFFSGTNDNAKIEIMEDITFAASTDLIIFGLGTNGGVEIDGTATNNGKVQMASIVEGTGTWVNANGSDLYIYDEEFDIALDADESFNIVHFSDVNDQNVIVPVGGIYNNLIIGGGGVKTMLGDLTISNFLVNNDTLDASSGNNYNITIAGDWLNKGIFFQQEGTVTFNGTGTQEILDDGGEQTFYNMTVNKSSGDILLFSDLLIENQFTFTSGDIIPVELTEQVTLGTSGTDAGSLVYSGTPHIAGDFERWINSTNAAAGVEFPVGSLEIQHLITVSSTNITSDGSLIVRFIDDDPGTGNLPLMESAITYDNTYKEGYHRLTYNNGLASTTSVLELDLANYTSFPIDNSETFAARGLMGTNWGLSGTRGTNDGSSVTRSNLLGSGEVALLENAACSIPGTPSFSVSDTDVCTGDADVTYTVTDPGGIDSWTWSVFGGTIDTQTDNSITVDWGFDGIVGEVDVHATNSCGDGPAAQLAVNIEPFITSSIVGNSVVPSGESGVSYSVTNNAGYIYNWTITGGAQASGTNTNAITVDWDDSGTGTVSVVADPNNGCGNASAEVLDVTIFETFTSAQTGIFDEGSTWIGGYAPSSGADVQVKSGHTVTLDNAFTTVGRLTIDNGATFDHDANSLIVQKNYVNNGIHDTDVAGSAGGLALSSSEETPTLDGNGTIRGATFTIGGGANWTISETANLTIDMTTFTINIDSLIVFGTLNIEDDIQTASTGELLASFVGSTVNYTGGVQTILDPADSYYNLGISLGGAKSLSGDITINGDFIDVNSQFSAGSNTVSFTGSGLQTIDGLTTISISNLIVNNSSGVVPALLVNDNLQVDGSMNLSEGVIELSGSNELQITSTATFTGGDTTAYVDGIIDWDLTNDATDYLFPVGDGAAYSPFEVNLPSGTSGVFSAQYFASAYVDLSVDGSLFEVTSDGYWEINDEGGVVTGGTPADLLRIYTNERTLSELPNIVDMRVARFNGADWSATDYHSGTVGYGSNSNGTYVEITNLTAFSPFTFGGIDEDALPVDYSLFKVERAGSGVDLVWVTESEINNDRFEIEHSLDGSAFSFIGSVEGYGNSNEPRSYFYRHLNPVSGTNFYRLKQVDFDGRFEYSDTKKVFIGNKDYLEVSVSPNPSSSTTRLTFDVLELHQPTMVSIIGINGIAVEQKTIQPGNGTFQLDASSLGDGIYIIKVIQGSYSSYVKFIVQH